MKLPTSRYVEQAKKLNEAIQEELGQGDYPVQAITRLTEELVREEGWEGWGTVRGNKDIEDVPFELWMYHLSLLTSAWVYWLYAAKARDRLSQKMLLNLTELVEQQSKLYLAASTNIFMEWDERAWAAIERDVRSGGSKAAHVHYGFWDSLSWWEKLKVHFRSPKK